mmetsp:Transcript_9731/g.13212  ORF Transcript_9731/g.13212 Transcript_9731/m.13212 type:complete len:191 (-) Transcript_9731:61-633(-)
MEQYIHRVGRTGRNGCGGHSYTFFTRKFAPVAPALLAHLRENNQEIDPNLVILAEIAEKAGVSATQVKCDEEEEGLEDITLATEELSSLSDQKESRPIKKKKTVKETKMQEVEASERELIPEVEVETEDFDLDENDEDNDEEEVEIPEDGTLSTRGKVMKHPSLVKPSEKLRRKRRKGTKGNKTRRAVPT